jgi:Na+-transporting NADH:ubiquinone oxidoreductase subunit NqrC
MGEQKMKNIVTTTLFVCLIGTAGASEQVFTFKNPSFNGSGYSNHVLSIEQLQFTRKKEAEEKAAADAAKAKREADSTTLAKFLNNIESRIYAQLSKQLVDNMFTDDGDSSGTATIEGATIYWVKDTTSDTITLLITEEDGSTTEIVVPLSGFGF